MSPSYKYTKLHDLFSIPEGEKVNIYGVVTEVEQQGNDRTCKATLRDETGCERILLGGDLSGLRSAHILRVHRALRRKPIDGIFVAGIHSGSTNSVCQFAFWLPDPSTQRPVYSSSANFTPVDVSILRKLTEFANNFGGLLISANQRAVFFSVADNAVPSRVNQRQSVLQHINKFPNFGYSDISVQIIDSVYLPCSSTNTRPVCIRAWDTFDPPLLNGIRLSLHNRDPSAEFFIKHDPDVLSAAADKMFDILCYDYDRLLQGPQLASGDWVSIVNVHGYLHNGGSRSKDPITLVLHEGGAAFGRKIVRLVGMNENLNLRNDIPLELMTAIRRSKSLIAAAKEKREAVTPFALHPSTPSVSSLSCALQTEAFVTKGAELGTEWDAFHQSALEKHRERCSRLGLQYKEKISLAERIEVLGLRQLQQRYCEEQISDDSECDVSDPVQETEEDESILHLQVSEEESDSGMAELMDALEPSSPHHASQPAVVKKKANVSGRGVEEGTSTGKLLRSSAAKEKAEQRPSLKRKCKK